MTPYASRRMQRAAAVALLRKEHPARVAVVADLPVPTCQLLVRLRGVAGIPADPCQATGDLVPRGHRVSHTRSVLPCRPAFRGRCLPETDGAVREPVQQYFLRPGP